MGALREAMAGFRRRYIVSALLASRGNRTQAALALGIRRESLCRYIRLYSITIPPTDREGGGKGSTL